MLNTEWMAVVFFAKEEGGGGLMEVVVHNNYYCCSLPIQFSKTSQLTTKYPSTTSSLA